MPANSLFRPLAFAEAVEIVFNDRPLLVPGGASVAAALLASGCVEFSLNSVGAPRAPYCMMGVCFECVLEIDGIPNRQACLTIVRAGMKIRSQAWRRLLKPQPEGARGA